MNTDTQISRGLERILAGNAGAYLEGLYGLAGLGACETFGDLEDASAEAGVPAREATRALRRVHKRACKCMRDAVPVAVVVQSALEEANGPGPLSFAEHAATLAGIGELLGATSLAKAQKAAAKSEKKLIKLNAKEAKQEAKVAAKVAKYEAAGKTAKAQKVIAKDQKQDAKYNAKVSKLQNVIAAANQAMQTITQAPTGPVTPTEAAAAVLTSQAQLPATAAVQQLAQEVVANATQPGSVMPSASLTAPSAFGTPTFDYPQGGGDAAPAEESGGGLLGNVPPWMLAAAAAGALFLFTSKKRSR